MNISRERLLELDASLCLRINGLSGKKVLDRMSYCVSRIGDGPAYFLILFIFILISNKPAYVLARDYLTAGAINSLLYKLLKGKVKRVRPFNALEAINKVMPPPDEFSFPSGHSGAAALFFYCTLIHMSHMFVFVTLIWMLLIGFSRVYNGVHYPGDVLAGYVMGLSVAKLTVIFYSLSFI